MSPSKDKKPEPAVLYVQVAPLQKRNYEIAAEQVGQSLREWVTDALDAAVVHQRLVMGDQPSNVTVHGVVTTSNNTMPIDADPGRPAVELDVMVQNARTNALTVKVDQLAEVLLALSVRLDVGEHRDAALDSRMSEVNEQLDELRDNVIEVARSAPRGGTFVPKFKKTKR